MNGLVLPNTPIAVDFWKPRQCPHVRLYFLTHMHADHTAGLTSSWNYHKIYCSEVTKKLAKVKLGINPEFLVALPLDQSVTIPLDERGTEFVTVTLLDANHCPGAVMLLLEGYFGRILYTGDFRFTKSMATDPMLCRNNNNGKVIDVLYLDNTYCDPKCDFPTRAEATAMVVKVIQQHPEHNIVIGIHAIGKEELLEKIALIFKTWIAVDPGRLKCLRICEQADVFDTDVESTRFRVVSAREITKLNIQRWNEERPTIAILPTCLYMGKHNPFRNIKEIFVVPYSDHSSFTELKEFVEVIRPKKVVPIVRKHTGTEAGFSNLRTDMSVFDDRLNPAPQTEFVVPLAMRKFMSVDNDCRTLNGLPLKRQASSILCRPRKKVKPCGVVFTSDVDDCVNSEGSEKSESLVKKGTKSSESLNGNSSAAVDIVNNSNDKDRKMLETVHADEEKVSILNGGKSLTSKCTESVETSDKGKDIYVIIISDSDDENEVSAKCQVTPTKHTCQHTCTRHVDHHRTTRRCTQHGGKSLPVRRKVLCPCHSTCNTNSPKHNIINSSHCSVLATNPSTQIPKSTSNSCGSPHNARNHNQRGTKTTDCSDQFFDSDITSCGESVTSHEADVTSCTKESSIPFHDGGVVVSSVESSYENDPTLQCEVTSAVSDSETCGGGVISCNDVTSGGLSVNIFGKKMISHQCSVTSHSSDGISHSDCVTAASDHFTSHDGVTASDGRNECCVTTHGDHRTARSCGKATTRQQVTVVPSSSKVSSSSDHSQPTLRHVSTTESSKVLTDLEAMDKIDSTVLQTPSQVSTEDKSTVLTDLEAMGKIHSAVLQKPSQVSTEERSKVLTDLEATNKTRSTAVHTPSQVSTEERSKVLTDLEATNKTCSISVHTPSQVSTEERSKVLTDLEATNKTHSTAVHTPSQVSTEERSKVLTDLEVTDKIRSTVAQMPNQVTNEESVNETCSHVVQIPSTKVLNQNRLGKLKDVKSVKNKLQLSSETLDNTIQNIYQPQMLLEVMKRTKNSNVVEISSEVLSEENPKMLTDIEVIDKTRSTLHVLQTANKVSTEETNVQDIERFEVLSEATDRANVSVLQAPTCIEAGKTLENLTDLNKAIENSHATVPQTSKNVQLGQQPLALSEIRNTTHSNAVQKPRKIQSIKTAQVVQQPQNIERTHSTAIQIPSEVLTEEKAKLLTYLNLIPNQAALVKYCIAILQTASEDNVQEDNQQLHVQTLREITAARTKLIVTAKSRNVAPNDARISDTSAKRGRGRPPGKAKTTNTTTAVKRPADSLASKVSPNMMLSQPQSDANISGTPAKRGRGRPPGKAKTTNTTTTVKRPADSLASKVSPNMMLSQPQSDANISGTPAKRGRGHPPGKTKTTNTTTAVKRPANSLAAKAYPVTLTTANPKWDISVDDTLSKQNTCRGHTTGNAKILNTPIVVNRLANSFAVKMYPIMMTTSKCQNGTNVSGTPAKQGREYKPGKVRALNTPATEKRPAVLLVLKP